MSLSRFCPECKACLTLCDSRISCLNLCFPNATAPLVTIIISLPWFCSMATWHGKNWHTFKLSKLGVGSHIWNMFGQMLIKITIAVFQFDITCSTMEASLPSARPHSSRVTTALPSFTTMRLACFNSLRWAKDFPWERGRESARHNIAYTVSMQGDMIVSQWWDQNINMKEAGGTLTFCLGIWSEGYWTDIRLPDSRWQVGARGQPSKHGNNTLGEL